MFAITPNDFNSTYWIKSMFAGCEIYDAVFYADKNNKSIPFDKMINYDLAIMINLEFNKEKFDVTFEDKTSDDFSIKGNIPVIQINYLFDTDELVPERDDLLISDGITEAKLKRKLYYPTKRFNDMTPIEIQTAIEYGALDKNLLKFMNGAIVQIRNFGYVKEIEEKNIKI